MNKKTILITGAASGIGRETALFFAKKDWYVGLFDINEDGLKNLATEIGSSNCFYQVMNVADPESVKSGVDAFARQTESRLNVLLNNAGILKFGLFDSVDLPVHSRIIDVNINGCMNCIFYCLPYLKKTKDARIINMSSSSSLYGVPELAIYSSTKRWLSSMTEALDIELEPYGIKVCDIKPPYVRTPMLQGGEDVKSMKVLSLLKFIGGQIDAIDVAQIVWKAVHKDRLHWKVGFLIKLMSFQYWALPFTTRFTMKFLTMPKVEVKQ